MSDFHFTVADKMPVIGLSGNFRISENEYCLARAYVAAVHRSGACPLILNPLSDLSAVERMLDSVDAVVFTGGGDFDAKRLGEPPHPAAGAPNPLRDDFEFSLIEGAMKRNMPILGICRGMQLLGVAAGGRMYQDLPSEYPLQPLLNHSQDEARDRASHSVRIVPGTLLEKLFEEYGNQLKVNSFHHQAVRSVSERLQISAFASDDVIEAVESAEGRPWLGVQWHPECLIDSQPEMNVLFSWLSREASSYRRCRQILAACPSFDAHCDAPMFFEGNYDLEEGGDIERGKIDFDAQGEERLQRVASRVCLRKMEEGGLDSIVMAAYIKQLGRDEEALRAAHQKAVRLIEDVRRRVAACPDRADIATTPADIVRLKSQGKRAVLLGIENAYALAKEVSNVDKFADMGVVYMTLCHNGHNDVCDSASMEHQPEHHGLSAFGREVVGAMNRRGMMIDLSHASEKSFYDALEASKAPIITTHSSVWELCAHRRNLRDDQLRALAQKGGMTGICIYSGFLAKDRPADWRDVVRHINYVRQLVGIDYVGIGSDFDGGGGVVGMNDCGDWANLVRALMAEGYSDEDISKVIGGNFLRVMREIQNISE